MRGRKETNLVRAISFHVNENENENEADSQSTKLALRGLKKTSEPVELLVL